MSKDASAHAAGPASEPEGNHASVDLLEAGQIDAAREAWRTLDKQAGEVAFACSWAWTEPWLGAYGDLVPHRFAIGRVDGEPCGIALVTGETRRASPMRIRQQHLGTAGEGSDEVYVCANRVLAVPRHAHAFSTALGSALLSEGGWEELRLDRFAPDALASLLDGLPNATTRTDTCPAVDLTAAHATDAEVIPTLRPETRRQIRRSLRGLGGVSTEVADGPRAGLDIFGELIELHQARWRADGKPGAFASRRFTQFHRAAVPRLVESGGALMMRVRSESRTVGCVYHLVDGDQVLTYAMGLMPPERKIKPGFVALACCMQRCHELGFAVYNHLPEPTPYKWELSNSKTELTSATSVRRGLKPAALDGARRLKRRIRSARS
jgi:CelD/BcsL family acetyltransferase involved in cellulose biosynthesis